MNEDNFTIKPVVRSDNNQEQLHNLIFIQRQLKNLITVVETMINNQK